MKKIFIFLWALTFSSSLLFAQWVNLGLNNLNVTKIQIYSDTAYAATSDGFYKKCISNSDTIWTTFGLQGKEVIDFISFNNQEIIASVYEQFVSIYKTTDGGTNWIDFQNGFGGTSGSNICLSLDAHPLYPDTIYARNSYAVAKSTDKGQSWQCVYENWGAVGYQSRVVQIDRNNPNIIWAGGELSLFQAYLLKSTDYGNTWQFIANEINPEENNASNCFFINQNNSDDVFVGMEGRIMRSLNGGSSWLTIFEPATYDYIYDVEVSPNNSNLIYAVGSENGTAHGDLLFYKSYDLGTTWDTIRYLDGSGVYLVADVEIVKNGNTDELFFASERGVYKYSNSGTNIDIKNSLIPISIYPNPTTGIITIEEKDIQLVEIKNINGQTIVQYPTFDNICIIDLSKQPKGIYFVIVHSSDFIKFKKIIVQ
ncbi:MAG: T9SS type A sorting domain-containing protein [Bacteroidales bacterium]|nr:T9SS type A sorting domain-containing protein [Bacteroidales bacterium]